MSDSRKKYEEMVEDGKIKNPFYQGNTDKVSKKSYRDHYDDFVDEHNDPENITLFCDYLDSIFKQ